MEEIKENEIFDSKYRRKKAINWLIRTVIAIILYIIFWDYDWVRWSLCIYIPLNLLGFIIIFAIPYYLKRKQEKLEKRLNEL